MRTRTTLFGLKATMFWRVLGHKPSQVPGTARGRSERLRLFTYVGTLAQTCSPNSMSIGLGSL